MAIDYRYLNRYTIGDALPMPDVQETLQRIGHASVISTFDLKSGYWQCPVRKEDQWLTAFVCGNDLYEWRRSPFGHRTSGNVFLRAMALVMEPLKDCCEAFVDDCAVYSKSWPEHLEHLRRFLSEIRAANLTLSLSKSKFGRSEVNFIGHIVGSGKRLADPEKVASIKNMIIPKTKKQVRQILGFFSYFRDYIKDFASIAKPLSDLTRKRYNKTVPWTTRENDALEKLKSSLIEATLNPLKIIQLNQPFNIHVDASNYAVGAVLSQTIDGKEQPVCFASAKFTDTQTRYSTIEKEAYGCLWSLHKFRHWILGSSVTLYSDHNPLKYLTENVTKSAKLLRWSLAIQEYPVVFKYLPGKQQLAADCLSRNIDN